MIEGYVILKFDFHMSRCCVSKNRKQYPASYLPIPKLRV